MLRPRGWRLYIALKRRREPGGCCSHVPVAFISGCWIGEVAVPLPSDPGGKVEEVVLTPG
jgi:hypothetical protein